MTCPICRRWRFGSRRIAAFSSGVSSTRNIRFDVATEDCHPSCFAVTRDSLFRPLSECIKLRFSYTILLECIIVGSHGNWPQSDDLIAMKNADVFALRGSLQK
jgi:hypothetical protein